MRTFHEENTLKVLASASSSDYTQVWEQKFTDADRILYILTCHASITLVKFSVQIASDSSGTGAADAGTTVTSATAGKSYTIEVTPGILTSTKTYVSPLVDVSAGTYTLHEIKHRNRNLGNFTQDSTYPTAVFNA